MTKLLYLEDTYKFESTGKILKIDKDSKGQFLILDRTIFYPQGGGQPSDSGQIIIVDKKITFNIHFVGFNNGVVHHYFKEDDILLDNLIEKDAELKVDDLKRINHAKSHTSGHLLANIVELIAPELKGIKGYHFPEGPYVEFTGKLSSFTNEKLINKTIEMIKQKIEEEAEITVKIMETEVSEHKSRLVQISGLEAVPCGGTHLSNLNELKEILIRKINFSKGNTKISYSYK
jgi:Ser-tRNA(Ala) deacylase AlaX